MSATLIVEILTDLGFERFLAKESPRTIITVYD